MTDQDLGDRTTALKAILDAWPGATSHPVSTGRAAIPRLVLYKIMGKVFAILAVRGRESVRVKCDPHLSEILREQYRGIDRHRHAAVSLHWISVDLDSDVPAEEVERLLAHSYDRVCAGLTRRQKAELAAHSSSA